MVCSLVGVRMQGMGLVACVESVTIWNFVWIFTVNHRREDSTRRRCKYNIELDIKGKFGYDMAWFHLA